MTLINKPLSVQIDAIKDKEGDHKALPKAILSKCLLLSLLFKKGDKNGENTLFNRLQVRFIIALGLI